MTRRTLLLGIVFASQFAVGCYCHRPVLQRPIFSRCPGCTPGFQGPAAAPVAAPVVSDVGGGPGCSSCGSPGAAYPVAGAPAPGSVAAYPTGYPGYTTLPSTVMPPPQVVKSGEAPMPMPTTGMK